MFWSIFINWLGQRSTLILLLVVNGLGTIYGYYWYKQQLLDTTWYLWPFVPDSPTASLFFTLFLLAFLLHKRWHFVEAFAAVTLYKYGLWASIMIVWTGLAGGDLTWQHYMLLGSHIGMAIQAILYSPYYSFKLKHLILVGIWTISNDMLDYSLGIFPWLHYLLHPYLTSISITTVGLSVTGLLLFYFLVISRKNKRLTSSA